MFLTIIKIRLCRCWYTDSNFTTECCILLPIQNCNNSNPSPRHNRAKEIIESLFLTINFFRALLFHFNRGERFFSNRLPRRTIEIQNGRFLEPIPTIVTLQDTSGFVKKKTELFLISYAVRYRVTTATIGIFLPNLTHDRRAICSSSSSADTCLSLFISFDSLPSFSHVANGLLLSIV